MTRVQLTRVSWLKAAKLDSYATCYFWLFQQSRLICPLHWKNTCRSERTLQWLENFQLRMVPKPQTPITECTRSRMCQILSWEKIWVLFVAVADRSLFILTHSQISRSELATPKPKNWQTWILSGFVQVANVGGTKMNSQKKHKPKKCVSRMPCLTTTAESS